MEEGLVQKEHDDMRKLQKKGSIEMRKCVLSSPCKKCVEDHFHKAEEHHHDQLSGQDPVPPLTVLMNSFQLDSREDHEDYVKKNQDHELHSPHHLNRFEQNGKIGCSVTDTFDVLGTIVIPSYHSDTAFRIPVICCTVPPTALRTSWIEGVTQSSSFNNFSVLIFVAASREEPGVCCIVGGFLKNGLYFETRAGCPQRIVGKGILEKSGMEVGGRSFDANVKI
mmetsp:Transcript_10617/g.15327  ORF Transcript_10617/g.15327 Transcript_10617/m.15327 type:complete len:223 (-) Transcript_10617:2384-3052(-)